MTFSISSLTVRTVFIIVMQKNATAYSNKIAALSRSLIAISVMSQETKELINVKLLSQYITLNLGNRRLELTNLVPNTASVCGKFQRTTM